MKANELRIGNLITIDNSVYCLKLKDIPLIVTHIGQTMNIKGENSHSVGCEHINQKPNTYYETYSQFIENIKPIHLTEEWLSKFGFKETKFGYIILNDVSIDYINGKCQLLYTEDSMRRFVSKSFRNVHQLQNLYYALTGEELSLSGI